MSDPIASTSLVEIRHLESGERVSDEQLTRYARHIIDQAGTSQHSNHVWQSPPMRRPPIGRFSSTRFAYSQPPPNKRSLIRTIPVAPPSNIPPLLDWGSSPTELENLGLSGLEEFRSAVKPSTIELPVVEQLLLKRRRSIEERPQVPGSSLTKKPRFAVAQPSPSNLASSVISTKVQNAALFALQSKSSTKGNGSVRLRLGLTKRTNIGSKLKPNRPLHTPHDLSVNVKLRPRLQAESDPSSFSTTEPSDSSSSVGGTFALRFKIPGSVLATSTNEKLQIQPPMKAMSGDSRTSNASKGSSSNVLDSGGRVLVPASPSLLTDRIMDVSKTRASDPKPSGSCVDTSMLLDSASEFSLDSSRNAISSLNPLPLLSAASPLQTNDHRAAPREGDSTNIESDILLSGSLSLPLEESGQSDSLARNDTCANLSSYLDTSYLLEPRQLMASVLCDSSHNSNDSQDDQLTRSLNPFAATSTTIDNYESPPWDLSQQDDQNVQSHDHDLRSPMSLTAAKRMEADSLHLDDSDMNEHSSDSSDPKSRYAKLGLISVLYDSSQDSLRSQPQKGTPRDQRHQGDVNHSIDGDVSIPRPSWSSDTSLQSRSNYLLSSTRASNSWGYSSRLTGTPDDLVSASHSLSLEDFEVRRPSDHQSRNASPVRSTPPTPPRPYSSNIPTEPTNGDPYIPSPHETHMLTDKRSGMTKLASYASTQGSLVGSYSPILTFTPCPKLNIPDNSLESIESPDTSQVINAGNSFRLNPIFRFPPPNPIPELEDDISCESQVLLPKLKSAPHGTQLTSRLAQTPDRDPTPENHRLRDDFAFGVPNSDRARAHESQIPASVDVKKNTWNQTIIKSDALPPAADQPSSSAPLPQPPSPIANKIYKGHLHSVIPQPHFLPSLPCPPPSLTEGMLASLVPPTFQNWLDKDGAPAQDQAAAAANFLSDEWGRAAWIIPVRGRAPWDGCSAAIVSVRPIKERKKRIIVWTPASLRSFWAQMVGFRDTKRVGSLSISFEAVPGKPPELESHKQASELKASRSFEFIKLYHDARVSLKLRTILQVLEFVDEDRYGIHADDPKEGELGTVTMRRLLGASTRLALLDGTGHIVLIS